MSNWTKDPIAVRLLTGKDEPETIYTFTAEAWYEQRKAWMAQGKFIAEERIIKLLEEYFDAWFALENPNAYDTGRTDGLASAIALIKGENK